jgi:hypothetical protein
MTQILRLKKKKPQFDKIKFRTKHEFSKWLKNPDIAPIKILLVDKGQDISQFWVHSTGEIIHSDFHSEIYRGKFIRLGSLDVGDPLCINKRWYYQLEVAGIHVTGRIQGKKY